MAGDGLRVLAVASGTLRRRTEMGVRGRRLNASCACASLALPGSPTHSAGVPAALRECYAAGIRTVMITGDYAGTAQIARQIGLAHPEAVVTGSELDAMTDAQLRERVSHVNIFARVVPEQKLRLVQAFKADGEVVAMTGTA
jgi:Ca2+-transporting ATPase